MANSQTSASKPRPSFPYRRQERADGGRHRPNVYGIPCCSRPVRGCESRLNMHMSVGDTPRPPVFGGNIREERRKVEIGDFVGEKAAVFRPACH
jgi:hypothetical protein